MKVTVCQIDPRAGQLDKDLERLAVYVAATTSDFLLLPEMCFSAWLAADAEPDEVRWASSVSDHENQIADLRSLGANAVVGTRPIVNEQGSRRNEAYLWERQGDVAAPFHQKHYLPEEDGFWEHRWYDRGPCDFSIARALGMRIGVQICTEMWFFEWARHYAALNADIVCVPRASSHGSTQKWLAGGQAMAVCSGAYSLSSNLWMPNDPHRVGGGVGWIIDPEGRIIAQTSANEPFATAEIDLDFARRSKSTYPRNITK